MQVEVDYSSRRISSDGPQADFRARYGAAGATYRTTAGSLDHWLTERYCLYTIDERRRVWRGEIHHPPCRGPPILVSRTEAIAQRAMSPCWAASPAPQQRSC